MVVEIHPPDSFHESLSKEKFNLNDFMGKWHVIYSTLPMWKSKKDVTITYIPLITTPKAGEQFRFNDVVEYRPLSSSSSTSKRSRIEGTDALLPTPPSAPNGYTSATSYQWRGKGWLMIASSKWQVLGYDPDEGWAVTYFAKTFFTPAGIDIYSRTEQGLRSELCREIITKTKALGGQVGELAESLFEVKRGD